MMITPMRMNSPGVTYLKSIWSTAHHSNPIPVSQTPAAARTTPAYERPYMHTFNHLKPPPSP